MSSRIITSQPPYRDDLDINKGYYRILYRPGYAVQARELTQQQSMIQTQIEKFGKHVFDEGSLVTGGQFDIDTKVPYVLLQNINSSGNGIIPSNFVGITVIGQTSGVTGKIIHVDQVVENGISYYVGFVRYFSGSETSSNSVFSSGEILEDTSNSLNTIVVKTEDFGEVSVTGKGSLFTIEEGVIFNNGLFIDFAKQSVILDAFSSVPSGRIGFIVNVSYVGFGDDESLLDNANGTTNYNAPGADRLKIVPVLTKITLDDEVSLPEFVELFTIKNGVVQRKYDRSQYAILGDEIAKRTYDESGDYCIKGMGIRIREHLDTGSNEGYLTSANGGDSSKLDINVEPGLAYVKGYEINKLVSSHVETNKSTAFEYVNSQILSARSSNYLLLEEVVGIPSLDVGTIVDLYIGDTGSPNVGEQRITNSLLSTASPSGTKIGTAKVKSLTYDSGTLGTPSGRLRLYLFDIQLDTSIHSFESIRSVHCSSPTNFFADVVLNSSGNANLNQKFKYPLLYGVGTNHTKTIRSDNDLSDTTFYFQRSNSNVIINSNGTLDIAVNITNEKFGYGAGTLSAIEKQSLFLSVNEDVVISMTGTVSGTSGTRTLSGSGTAFTRLNVGDKIEITGITGTYIISSITNDTSLTVDRDLTGSPSGAAYDKVYYTGDYINLHGKGSDSGTSRTVTCNSTRTSLSFDLQETFSGTVSASIGYKIVRSSAYETRKQLRSNRFVQIDCSIYDWGSPEDFQTKINLGFSDIFQIRQIRKHSSSFSSSSDGTDVTDQFIFNNGQTDDYYDHGYVQLKDGYTLDSSDYLLIELDYFKPDYTLGMGYFSVDSYPINDTEETDTTIFTHEIPVYISTETGQSYNLRDYLDFRAVKTNTATDATIVGSASTNPATTDTFIQASNGLRIAYPGTQITLDYSYYLARRDIVTLDINGNFGIIKGISDTFPVSPPVPETVMGVAKVYIPPYPSLATTYARIIGREDIACSHSRITFERHTMRDIGVLKSRIKNLEYYTSLNALEKDVTEQKILDENGLERFKNGMFVNPFVDHSVGDTKNDDYKIAVDKKEKCLRPRFIMEALLFRYLINASNNVTMGNSMVTLDYEETPFIEQLKATSYRNIEQSVFRFIGTIEMLPDTDIWVDTTTVDKTIYQDFSQNYNDSLLGTEWGSWESYVTGYSAYDRNYNDRTGELVDEYYIGTYSTYAQAVEALKVNDPAGSNMDGTWNEASRGIVVTEYSDSREGIKTIIDTETSTENYGTFVTDVSLATYIRPQNIKVVVRGLKAHTIFYAFFDGEDMSEYCSSAIIPNDWDGSSSYSFTYNTEGTTLKSNAYGELVFNLRLPEDGKRFRVGTKEVKVTDSPTNSIDASSYAENYFVGHGLIQQKQNTIISTKQTIVKTETLNESREVQETEIYGPSCMAYSFFAKAPPEEDVIFLTSVDVWIQSIDDANELGVWFEIREMNNAGGITRTQVPYSEVWMAYGDSRIKTSSDGSEYTRVNFPNPVILQNNTQYAFLIHTEGLNPNTYFYISRLGEIDIETGKQVTARPLTGTVYTTNNNLNWDIVLDIDLKVRFNRAKFEIGSGTVTFGNVKNEFFTVQDRSQTFVYAGEEIRGSEYLTLSNVTGTDSIEVGDFIVGSSSGVSGEILSIDDSTYYTDEYNYISGETFTIESISSPTGIKDVTGQINTIIYGSGTLQTFNRRSNKMVVKESNGQFFDGCSLKGMISGTTAKIASIDKYYYSTIYFNPNYLTFKNTTLDFALKGIDSTINAFSSWKNIVPKTNVVLETQYDLYSHSKEITLLESQSSVQSLGTLETTSDWVSPVIDTNRSNGLFVYNIINDDITGEDKPFGGNLENKYISPIITLAEGQDAEDLLVQLTAYVPPGITDKYPIKVWAKIKNNEDGDLFKDKPWIELENKSDIEAYSSLKNKYNYRDFSFGFPDELILDDEINPGVQYTSNGNVFTGFKQFSLKIGLLGDENNTAIVPKVANCRAIALQL